jgi:small neutral amino acid transporter SnatA (MarC family)
MFYGEMGARAEADDVAEMPSALPIIAMPATIIMFVTLRLQNTANFRVDIITKSSLTIILAFYGASSFPMLAVRASSLASNPTPPTQTDIGCVSSPNGKSNLGR